MTLISLPENPFEFIGDVERRAKEELLNPPPALPMAWWDRFTEMLGGLRMHEFTVLSAATGAGKTTLTAQVVCQTLLEGAGTYICSAEIGNVMFYLAMLSAFDRKNFVRGDQWERAEIDRLIAGYGSVMRSARIVFSRNDDRIEPGVLFDEAEQAHRQHGAKLVILDNLQFLMPIVDTYKQQQTTDLAIRDLKRFVRRVPVHVILIAHPKKLGAEGGRITSEENVKGSSTIYQECDNFLALNRVDMSSSAAFNYTDRQLLFLKARRRGEIVGQSVYFEFDRSRYVEKAVKIAGGGR